MYWKAAILLAGVIAAVVIAGGWYFYRPQPVNSPIRSLSLVISGDTAGWIVPCGCASNQSGGLLRRGTYVAEVRRKGDVIVADVGGAPAGTSEYQRLKFEAILRGELAMGVAAHNLGGPEVALGVDYLRNVARTVPAPLVSANARDAFGKLIVPAARIVELSGRRVALLGVVSPRFSQPGVQIGDPREATVATARELAGRYDSLVVLAYLPEEEILEFAGAIPEADVVVGGPTGQSMQPRQVGPTLLGSATNKGKFLIHVVAPFQGGGRWSGQVIDVAATLAEDPAQVTNLRRFHDQLAQRDFAAADTGLVPELPAGLPADYAIAGSETCVACHEQDCQVWDETRHATAWKTLTEQGYHVDPFCQQCHTTGYGLPAGFVSARRSGNRTNVGCESCHGPSLAHQRDSAKKPSFAAADQCAGCHDRENSPKFEYASYWEQIRHGSGSQ